MAYEAGRVVAQLEARNDQFDARMLRSADITDQSMSRVERSAASAERAISRSSSVVVASQGQVAQSTRNLGFQISDVGQQLSGGQSPFVIFGQQAPQFVQAFDEIAASGARVGQVLRSVALPGILAVISVLATLIERNYGAAQAEGVHKGSTDALREAVDRLAGAAARNNHQTEIGIQLDLRKAEAQRQITIQTRQRIETELRRQRAELGSASVTEAAGVTPIPGRGAASRQANIDDLNRQLRDNSAAIKEVDLAIATNRSALIMRGVAAATDATAAATQRYERTIDSLQRRFQRGTIDQGTFERLAIAATRQRDATLQTAQATDRGATASRGHAVTLNLQASGAREAAAAQRELESALGSLIQRYDPLSAAAAQYAQELKNIAALEQSGKLDADQAGRLREGAGSAYRKTRADAFNLPSVEEMRPEAAQDERDAKEAARVQEEAARDAERASQAVREQNIRSLANIYEDVFTRSSGQVWQNFKRDGLRALAVILAQATVSSFGKGGGGLGSLLGNISSAAGAYFGGARAMGGPVSAGTTYLVGERGPELLRMGSQGGVITPNNQIGAANAVAARSASSSAAPAMPPIVIQLAARKGDAFAMEVLSVTGPQTVQILQQAAPGLVQAATVNTVAELRKPGL